MSAQRGLGKGLGALLGESAMQPAPEGGALMLALQKVEPNPDQPRRHFDEEALQELADSIRQHGIIQPLTVRKLPTGFYQIIAGERRWRAARMAGLREVPVTVIEADDKTAMELALIENLQRADLDPIEEARGYQQLMQEYGMTQSGVAERVGKSRPAVANALRLLALSAPVLDMVAGGAISAGHARAILTLTDEHAQLAVAQKVQNLQLSVRQTELMCKNMAKPAKKAPPPARRSITSPCASATSAAALGAAGRSTTASARGAWSWNIMVKTISSAYSTRWTRSAERRSHERTGKRSHRGADPGHGTAARAAGGQAAAAAE